MRDKIVKEALSWLKTPWHHDAKLKGVGVDCAQFLVAVYGSVFDLAEFQYEPYSPEWHLHKDEPRFVNKLLEYCDQVEEALPGDIVMFKYGRHAAHGSIVVEWPVIIHAWRDERMVTITDLSTSHLKERFAGIYRYKGLK